MACSTLKGEASNLEMIPWSDVDAQFRCQCRGSSDTGATQRDCALYVWRCMK